ncbi:MAG: hypothetical protein ABWY57_08865 [Mycetocola sp.]
MPGPEGIGHGDVEVRPVERQVVVPTFPEQDVALLLGLLEDRSVVDARVHDRAGLDVGLVLLPFLNRHVGAVEVLERLELCLARQRVSGRTTNGISFWSLKPSSASRPITFEIFAIEQGFNPKTWPPLASVE